METLLSHSFDYLSSASPQKIRKGLRQVEGLLAQICMSKTTNPANKRHSMLALGSTPPPSSPKKLTDLHADPAYREFFKLQQSFQWNVCMRLISCLERLLGKESNGTNDLLVIQTLELIQGVLLLHPPSRELFAREIYMNLFLDLLDPQNCPAIQSSTLLALVTSLLDQPLNTRTFETLDGLLVITSLSKSRTTSREVKMKLVEFLYFYLMPEVAPPKVTTSATNTAILGGRGRELRAAFADHRRRETITTHAVEEEGDGKTRSQEEKQNMLSKYLNNVQDLVEDLKEGGGPFGVGS
ncbi:hypothetical protein PMZ80_010792 [Knufia obscura]|uniref:Cell division control protein 14 n=1 Tax=Knufia obscura TaxID=1635080 RepID=A0ABR0RA10_9EURO|nr:hypothetical protein PMZ80_010792 [Knufia obscura]